MNPLTIITITLSVGCILYMAGVIVIMRSLSKIAGDVVSSRPFVSVVIAARNEQDTVGNCLDSLMAQDYPDNKWEIIVVDDRSTDNTAKVISSYMAEHDLIRTISVDTVPSGVSPKKNALTQAIRSARGEIILQTDADCIVPESWVTEMAGRFGERVGMVTGLSPYRKDKGVLNSFICHEYLWNAALSAGSIALGHGTHATGRNLAFRKGVFNSTGGYGESETVKSGDDTLHLHRIQKMTGHTVVTNVDPKSHVYTDAPETYAEFFRQRTRHMSTGKLFDPVHLLIGSAIYSFNIVLAVAIIAVFIIQHVIYVVVSGLALKFLIDALAAVVIKKRLGLDVQWSRFVINELLLLLYFSIMPILGMFVPVRWKEK